MRIFLVACFFFIAACTTVKPHHGDQDYAPSHDVDVQALRDAVPKQEPRSKYGNPKSYCVLGHTYRVMASSYGFRERGIASWYGMKFNKKRTSSGEIYNLYAMTAAHKTLPLPTYVRVVNLQNRRSCVVKVNDRGPFKQDRILDLSYAAARKLGVFEHGTALVEITALDPSHPRGNLNLPTSLGRTPHLYLQVGAFASKNNADAFRMKVGALAKPYP